MLIKLLIFIMLLSQNVFCKEPDPYVEKFSAQKYLKLLNGNEVIISYHSPSDDAPSKIRIFMRNKKQILWDKTFDNNYGEAWYKANFIPITPDRFIEDLNDDTFPEIGIAIWNGGTASWEASAIIFSVKENELVFLKKQQINIEFSRSVYKTKTNFFDPNYKCPVCEPKEYFYKEGKSKKLKDWPK